MNGDEPYRAFGNSDQPSAALVAIPPTSNPKPGCMGATAGQELVVWRHHSLPVARIEGSPTREPTHQLEHRGMQWPTDWATAARKLEVVQNAQQDVALVDGA